MTSWRVKDTAALRRKVRRDPSCRACGERGTDAHHVIFRSHGGDDVEENIVCLCNVCHRLLHYSAHDEDRHRVRSEIGQRLTSAEMGYAVRRLGKVEGRSFLRRHYNVAHDDSRYPTEEDDDGGSRPRGLANLRAIEDL